MASGGAGGISGAPMIRGSEGHLGGGAMIGGLGVGAMIGGSAGGLGGAEKWSSASLAASFCDSLEELEGLGVSKERPLTVTAVVKRGMCMGPSLVVEYWGRLHCFWWQSS